MDKYIPCESVGTTIEKLVYRRDYFDCMVMRAGARVVTTITPDGLISTKEYAPGSRKVKVSRKARCTPAEYGKLCCDVEICIATADRQDWYCDDSGEELKIFHRFGRIQTMDRGLGNESTHIGEIVNAFLVEHGD